MRRDYETAVSLGRAVSGDESGLRRLHQALPRPPWVTSARSRRPPSSVAASSPMDPGYSIKRYYEASLFERAEDKEHLRRRACGRAGIPED